jgi:hypothetical protein
LAEAVVVVGVRA